MASSPKYPSPRQTRAELPPQHQKSLADRFADFRRWYTAQIEKEHPQQNLGMALLDLPLSVPLALKNRSTEPLTRALRTGEMVQGSEFLPEIASSNPEVQFWGRELPGLGLEFLTPGPDEYKGLMHGAMPAFTRHAGTRMEADVLTGGRVALDKPYRHLAQYNPATGKYEFPRQSKEDIALTKRLMEDARKIPRVVYEGVERLWSELGNPNLGEYWASHVRNPEVVRVPRNYAKRVERGEAPPLTHSIPIGEWYENVDRKIENLKASGASYANQAAWRKRFNPVKGTKPVDRNPAKTSRWQKQRWGRQFTDYRVPVVQYKFGQKYLDKAEKLGEGFNDPARSERLYVFRPTKAGVVINSHADERTLAHELNHHVDKYLQPGEQLFMEDTYDRLQRVGALHDFITLADNTAMSTWRELFAEGAARYIKHGSEHPFFKALPNGVQDLIQRVHKELGDPKSNRAVRMSKQLKRRPNLFVEEPSVKTSIPETLSKRLESGEKQTIKVYNAGKRGAWYSGDPKFVEKFADGRQKIHSAEITVTNPLVLDRSNMLSKQEMDALYAEAKLIKPDVKRPRDATALEWIDSLVEQIASSKSLEKADKQTILSRIANSAGYDSLKFPRLSQKASGAVGNDWWIVFDQRNVSIPKK